MNLKFKSMLLKSETREKKIALSVDRAHVYSFCYVCCTLVIYKLLAC